MIALCTEHCEHSECTQHSVHNTSLALKCTENSVLSKQRALSTQCPSPSRHSVLSASIVCGPGGKYPLYALKSGCHPTHSLHQLPKRGTHTALSPLMRLRMCWSCVFTQALENLPYLRSFSADSAYYLFRIRTQDQNIIPTQEPRPNGVPQTQYGDRRCPLCPGRHLGSESHLYLSCTVTSPLAHPLISELRIRFPWDGFTQQQQMALLLGTMPQDPVAQRHK